MDKKLLKIAALFTLITTDDKATFCNAYTILTERRGGLGVWNCIQDAYVNKVAKIQYTRKKNKLLKGGKKHA